MLKIKTRPSALITNADVKSALKITHAEDDAEITKCIARAMAYLDGHEGYMGRAIAEQVWTQTIAEFPADIRLELGPVQSVDAITYLDSDGVEQTVDPTTYYLHHTDRWSFVSLVPGASWPGDVSTRKDAVKVEFTAGDADDSPDLDAIKQGAIFLAAHFHENPLPVESGPAFELPFGVRDILAPYRILL